MTALATLPKRTVIKLGFLVVASIHLEIAQPLQAFDKRDIVI